MFCSNKAKSTTENKRTRKMENDLIGRLYRLKIYVHVYTTDYITTTKQNFQFNVFNRIVPNNSFSSKCKIVSSSLCDFCNANPGSLKQMFGECHHIHSFWTSFTNQIISPLTSNKTVNFKHSLV